MNDLPIYKREFLETLAAFVAPKMRPIKKKNMIVIFVYGAGF